MSPGAVEFYIGHSKMETPVNLSHTSALILQTISHGYRYGFDIMDVTGLPSGTVYPALPWQRADEQVQPYAATRLRCQCWGAFLDAAWHRCNREPARPTGKHWLQRPTSALVALAGALALLALASGNFTRMRSILLKPPYFDPQHIVTISRTGVISSAEWVIPYSWVGIWRKQKRALEGVAAYTWKPHATDVTIGRRHAHIASVRVEDDLFHVFGVRALMGRTFRPSDAQDSRIGL